ARRGRGQAPPLRRRRRSELRGLPAGVDADKLRAALHHASAQNWAMDQRSDLSGMPWAEKDMSIVLREADLARLSLPLCGSVKETIKGLKIRMGLGLPHGSEQSGTNGYLRAVCVPGEGLGADEHQPLAADAIAASRLVEAVAGAAVLGN